MRGSDANMANFLLPKALSLTSMLPSPPSASPVSSLQSAQLLKAEQMKMIQRRQQASDQVDSANLPAEFRGLDHLDEDVAPREQSKLAKLCQQTSSVLASVLPAPFGGHKRSILCQFFGQVPLSGPGKATSGGSPKKQQVAEGGTIAVVQHGHQPPVTLPLTAGRHPIQLVLEHQLQYQQQMQKMQQMNQQQQQQHQMQLLQPGLAPLQLSSTNSQHQFGGSVDLKSAASIIDYAYHQKLEPPEAMMQPQLATFGANQNSQKPIKFNQPLGATASFRPLSAPMLPAQLLAGTSTSSSPSSSSGWRIFNQSNLATNSGEQSPSSTTPTFAPASSTMARNGSQAKLIADYDQNDKRQQQNSSSTTLAPQSRQQQSSMDMANQKVDLHQSKTKPVIIANSSLANIATKRSEALKSTTRSMTTSTTSATSSEKVRIIEVSNNNTDNLVSASPQKISSASDAKGTIAAAPTSGAVIKLAKQLAGDNKEVPSKQKREELVIASINNLTRIAFGNQLRDTVKVINKLIDQQLDLFGGNPKPKTAANSNSDQVQSESGRVVSVVSANGVDKSVAAGGSKKTTGDLNMKSPSKISSSSFTRKATVVTSSTTTTQSLALKTTAKPTKRAKKGAQESLRLTPIGGPNSTSQLIAKGLGDQKSSPKPKSPTIKPLANSRVELSRSLWTSSSPLMRKSYATTPRALPAKLDDFEATTIGDLRRDHTPWRRSQQQPGRLLTRPSPYAGVSLNPMKSMVATTTTSTSKPPQTVNSQGDWHLPPAYPWLLPDKSLFGSDMFQSIGGQSSERVSSTVEAPKKSTTTSSYNNKQATLVLNRIQEPEMTTKHFQQQQQQQQKFDSLTTLKMSLTTTTAPSSSKMIWTNQKEQSRWIPSTIMASTTTSTTSTTTTQKPSTTLTSASVSELIEARASDSISKYTSHWTNEANELLATTTRRMYRGEPMPQIAQTGEFFNAETIANWPERYQTMLEAKSMPSFASSTSPQVQPVETTRRNGETYDNNLAAPRHKLDETSKTTTRSLLALIEPNQTSLSILPPNHKLTSTTTSIDTNKPDEPTETSNTYTSSPPVMTRQTVSGPTMAYTLIGPITQSDSDEAQQQVQQNGGKFPLVSGGDDEQVSTTKPPTLTNFTANFTSLKAPYLQQQSSQGEDMMQLQQQQQSLSGATSRPYVSRKLYELLVPSTRHFVGAQNPLNQQRFNLSALKFLAQNLLTSKSAENETNIEHPAYLQEPVTNLTMANGSATNQHLIDLLESSDNYYDMLMNDTSTSTSTNSTESSLVNKTLNGGKSILGRAGNLLNDLRQLEQKKAAAIMAAIRYQVPGPLVRPWDLNSDLFRQALGISDGFGPAALDSRHDKLSPNQGETEEEDQEQEEPLLRNYLRDSLVVAQASKLIKAALAKQRLVSRDVLEARLNGKEVAFLDKRLDHDVRNKSGQLDVAYSFGDHDNQAGVFNGSRHDDADYVPVAQDHHNNHQYHHNNRNFTRRWLDKLFNRANSSADAGAVSLNSDQIISSRDDSVEGLVTAGQSNSPRIGDSDHQSVRAGGGTALKEALINREMDEKSSMDKFDCSDKQAGFYPDTRSACQTFYHCSSTGHLLTFNCPQQTRFDEKSLKCGPWFEINCDLTRNKHRRPAKFN